MCQTLTDLIVGFCVSKKKNLQQEEAGTSSLASHFSLHCPHSWGLLFEDTMEEDFEIEIISPQAGPQEDFINVPDNVNIVLYGGAAGGGKSYALLMDTLKYIDDPYYNAVYFRSTTTQLEESLWPEAISMFLPFLTYQSGPNKGKFIGKAKIREKNHLIVFPSGARVRFAYLELEKHKLAYQGAQFTRIYFDEFTHFSESQVNYLRTRLRSKSKYKPALRASMNPDPDHFVRDWVEPYLDEDGYPKKELSGKIRYMLYFDGKMFSDWDKEKLKKNFPKTSIRTYTFIPSSLHDNKILIENNPEYEDDLEANTKAEKAALLGGCWNYQLNEGSYFDRNWVPAVPRVPDNCLSARAWDKASSIPTDINPHPDFTAGVKIYKDTHGIYYLVGEYHPLVKDETDIAGRFRALPGERDALIEKQAELDTDECVVVFSKDPGQAGDTEYLNSAKKLIEKGFTVRPDPMPNNKSKTTRFSPFSSACQNGLVRIVPSTWPSKASYEHFLKELEQFNGEPSTSRKKDDIPDGAASCFNYLAKEQVIDIKGLSGALSKINTSREGREKLSSIMTN